MKFSAVLASAAWLAAVPALAGEPPTEGRIYAYAQSDSVTAFVDFATLQFGPTEIRGWVLKVYTPPRAVEGLADPIASTWEETGGDCVSHYIVRYSRTGYNLGGGVILPAVEGMSPVRVDAKPDSFEQALLDLICPGEEPGDISPYATQADAARAVREGN